MALLDSALNRRSATFDKKELYPDIVLKAAALMHSIIKDHPFVDGNKRTAITSASIFLSLNGRQITAANEELESFTLTVASKNMELKEISNWFKKNSVKGKKKAR